MDRVTLFADVLLPISLKGSFTYRVPFALNEVIKPLVRVIVPFGNKRIATGVVLNVHDKPPQKVEARYIDEILDEVPLVTEHQVKFWQWMAAYYVCAEGEVLSVALPSGLKLQGETNIMLNTDLTELSTEGLSEREISLLYHLDQHQKIRLADLPQLLSIKTVYPIVKKLWHEGLIRLEDEVKERFKPMQVDVITLHESFLTEIELGNLIEKLQKAPKQLDILLAWLELSGYLQKESRQVLKSELLAKSGSNLQALQQLIKKKIIDSEKIQVSRLKSSERTKDIMPVLSEIQQKAHDEILNGFAEQKTCLLHGVTSSGKTEIYIRLIEKVIDEGKQSLYLLPEIALTAQIIVRLQAYFGDKVQVYHSKFSENERAEVWRLLIEKKNQPILILGARSSIFLPFSNLGLIIVDEDHENSYKQQDPAPRYHARDAAIMLAHQFKANCLLGSATPAIESFYNAMQGKYKLVELHERFGNALVPDVLINDLRTDKKKKQMQGVFSKLMLDELKNTLQNKRQSILFQNRRGFSPSLECDDCGSTPECIHCDISLTYHKRLNQLRCHYCGYNINVPQACKECGSTSLKTIGFGTEKIEEDLQAFLPEANIQRLDLDTTRSKYAYYQILEAFEHRKIDVLVGTQMVTKGLDFDAVDLVGVMNADAMINYPDFRASERAFQLMLQVAGRAGRRDRPGKVVIQTHQPQHKIFNFIIAQDYKGFYQSEIEERKQFNYPPFVKLIIFTIKHKEAEMAAYSANHLSIELRKFFGEHILGPEEPPVARVRNLFLRKIILKIPPKFSIHKVKNVVEQQVQLFNTDKRFKGARAIADVDPA